MKREFLVVEVNSAQTTAEMFTLFWYNMAVEVLQKFLRQDQNCKNERYMDNVFMSIRTLAAWKKIVLDCLVEKKKHAKY